ncbi:hypothetical protein DAPPUDRAFT_122704, partial [Daphnia pulex]
KLMCLHLLPKGKIAAVFGDLRLAVEAIQNRDERKLVKKLCAYVDETWIDTTMWPPSKWSVHMQKVRTTNDVEGWHNHLHNHAGQKYSYNGLNMYLLFDVLNLEALQVDKNAAKLLQGHKLRRERKSFMELNSNLKELWRRHATSELSTKNLLSECANMYTKYNTVRYAASLDDDRECELEEE